MRMIKLLLLTLARLNIQNKIATLITIARIGTTRSPYQPPRVDQFVGNRVAARHGETSVPIPPAPDTRLGVVGAEGGEIQALVVGGAVALHDEVIPVAGGAEVGSHCPGGGVGLFCGGRMGGWFCGLFLFRFL